MMSLFTRRKVIGMFRLVGLAAPFKFSPLLAAETQASTNTPDVHLLSQDARPPASVPLLDARLGAPASDRPISDSKLPNVNWVRKSNGTGWFGAIGAFVFHGGTSAGDCADALVVPSSAHPMSNQPGLVRMRGDILAMSTSFVTSRTPYFHWGQATMFKAMASFLLEVSRYQEQRNGGLACGGRALKSGGSA